MVTVAVTGHVKLNAEDAAWIFDAFVHRLHRLSGAGLHGITCLAMGTDQIFARAILSLSGTFEVVLPAQATARRWPARPRPASSRNWSRRPITCERCRLPNPVARPTWPPAKTCCSAATCCWRLGRAALTPSR